MPDTPRAPSLDVAVVLVWRNLGPYHVARAAASAQLIAKQKGQRVVVIQLAEQEAMRDWRLDLRPSCAHEMDVRTLASGSMLRDSSVSLARQMRKTLNQLKPLCVAVAGYDRPEMREALRWANRQGAVAILMSETKWDDRPRPWWKRALAARWVRRADAALVSGAAAGEYLVSLGFPRERIFRQYGVVDNDFFAARAAEARRRRLIPKDALPDKYFIACCRLIEQRKNLKRLFLAYEQYRRSVSSASWGLVVCGDGEDRAMLEDFVRQRQIDGVVFAGFQQAEQLALYYAGASCFVHPAINEAWGLVINEAMAAGLPVLASRRCGATYDLVHEGVNGFSFDPYDVQELAGYLAQIAATPVERRMEMGQASQRIIRDWGPDRFAMGLYQAMKVADRGSK